MLLQNNNINVKTLIFTLKMILFMLLLL